MDYYDQIAEGYNNLHEEEQKKKLSIIKEHLHPKKEDKLLDVGCGTGISSDWPCKVVGIDPSQELLKQNPHPHKLAAAENIPFPDNSFEYIISLTAIQNFNDIEKGLKEIKRVSKQDAELALTFLRKSAKRDIILELIQDIFSDKNMMVLEEDKDVIVLLL